MTSYHTMPALASSCACERATKSAQDAPFSARAIAGNRIGGEMPRAIFTPMLLRYTRLFMRDGKHDVLPIGRRHLRLLIIGQK